MATLTPEQTKSITTQIAQIQAGINKLKSGSTSTSSGSSGTTGGTVMYNKDGSSYLHNAVSTNPADAPGYNPRTDPKSSAYDPNFKAPPTELTQPTSAPATQVAGKPTGSQYTVKPGDTLSGIAGQYGVSTSAISGYKSGDPNKIFPGETLSIGDQYKAAHQLAQQTGIPASQGAGGGALGAQQYLQAVSGPEEEATSILAEKQEIDPAFDSIYTMMDEFYSPQNQRTSLLDEYNKMSKSLGIQQMNQELIDAKRIIEGTEDDIRAEVTAAGGLATDSMVLAMANARNKSLVKNYNYLLESRDNAMQQLNTMMDLTMKDREMAQAEFDRKLNFAFKVAEFKERATTNARTTYMSLGEKLGWDTLLSQSSPYEQSVIGKTLGLNSSGLQQLALRSQQDRAMAMQDAALDRRYKQAQIDNIYSQIDERNEPDEDEITPQKQELALAQTQGNIQQISDLIGNKYIKDAVGPNKFARFAPLSMFTGGKTDFIASVEQIRSQLNLDTLIQAKAEGATFGALSDQELRVLSNAASKIGSYAQTNDSGKVTAYKATEQQFKAELDKINNFAKLDFILKGGDPESVGVIQLPDGKYATKNSDGSVTILR